MKTELPKINTIQGCVSFATTLLPHTVYLKLTNGNYELTTCWRSFTCKEVDGLPICWFKKTLERKFVWDHTPALIRDIPFYVFRFLDENATCMKIRNCFYLSNKIVFERFKHHTKIHSLEHTCLSKHKFQQKLKSNQPPKLTSFKSCLYKRWRFQHRSQRLVNILLSVVLYARSASCGYEEGFYGNFFTSYCNYHFANGNSRNIDYKPLNYNPGAKSNPHVILPSSLVPLNFYLTSHCNTILCWCWYLVL